MSRIGHRRLGGLLIVAAAVPLVVASAAYACARLATLNLETSTARSGTEVRFIGRNFSTSPPNSAVQIRWRWRGGATLWEGRPTERGTISGSITVPRGRAGNYVVLGTQYRPDGRPASGTPARAALRIPRARHSRRGEAVPAVVSSKPADPSGPAAALETLRSATPAPVTLGALLAAFALAGSGLAVLFGGRRQIGLTGARRLR